MNDFGLKAYFVPIKDKLVLQVLKLNKIQRP